MNSYVEFAMGTYKYRRKESFSLRLCLLTGVYTYPDGGYYVWNEIRVHKIPYCYLLLVTAGVENAVSSTFAMPSLCLRPAFVLPSLPSMEHLRNHNGTETEVQLHRRELKVLAESH